MKNKGGVRTAKLVIVALFYAFVLSFLFYVNVGHVAHACDPSPLQDFCVGVDDPKSTVNLNGELCKNPEDVTINDFVYKGFNIAGDTNNTQGANATLIDITRFPAVNTQGVSTARVDFAPFGLNTLHLHPRGSEIFAVLKGTLYAGFVTTDNKLFDTILKKGDVIVFPQGLVHFQFNIENKKALAIASFGSQNPGRVNVANAVFGSTPNIIDGVLTNGFQVDEQVVKQLLSQFSSENKSIKMGRSVLKLLSQTL